MTWAKGNASGQGQRMTSLSLSLEVCAPIAEACQRLPLTTLTDAPSIITKKSGHIAFPSTGAKPKKASFRCYAPCATGRKDGLIYAQTTTVNTNYLYTLRQVPTKANLSNVNQPLRQRQDNEGPEDHKRSSGAERHTVRGADVALLGAWRWQDATSSARGPVLPQSMAEALGNDKVHSQPVQRRSNAAKTGLLPLKFRVGNA
jgi:hypothetical protein